MDVLSWRELVTRGRYFYKFRGIDPTAHRTTLDRSHFRNKKKKKIKKMEKKEKGPIHTVESNRSFTNSISSTFLCKTKNRLFQRLLFFIFIVEIVWPFALLQEFANLAKESFFDDFRDIDRCKNCSFYFHRWRNLVVFTQIVTKNYVDTLFVDIHDYIEGSVWFGKVISLLVCLTLKNSQTDLTMCIVRLLIPMFVNVSKGLLWRYPITLGVEEGQIE